MARTVTCTEPAFLEAVREFWFEAAHIPKYIARCDLWIVKLPALETGNSWKVGIAVPSRLYALGNKLIADARSQT